MRVNEKLHNNQIGKALRFEESSHSYFYQERPCISVTRLIDRYKKPFDATKLAPRTASKLGISTEEVLEIWKQKGEESAYIGTQLHLFAENILSHSSVDHLDFNPRLEHLYRSFLLWWKSWKEDSIVEALETPIVDPEYHLAGTFDLLLRRNEKLVLVDYKTNQSFHRTSPYKERFLPPIQHLDVCEFTKYALQSSFYRYMLEKLLDEPIVEGYCIWFGPTETQVIEMPLLEAEREQILADYLMQNQPQ